ncbi:hypothetical protein [Halovenus halobia]|uniref:hypothetical protein n=1 Tax=Halovenus halobia TaxID=3396622 RepID=UPI003F552E53
MPLFDARARWYSTGAAAASSVAEQATAAPTQELHEIGLKCLRYLQPRGVRDLTEITDRLDEYDGNPIVREVKETGQTTPDTGPVSRWDP